ncbi:trypsin delta/gamma-like protein CG30031 [Diachasma alloeum]|uniref:trypsin delta/gamma-like protein CG30031 n=1 Tax=Diachasma alloeum TaxID=454923 RepID=UPI0007383A2B|nr:trypsin delta/gamma-like protein CG30031 [Diachasma alloeum]
MLSVLDNPFHCKPSMKLVILIAVSAVAAGDALPSTFFEKAVGSGNRIIGGRNATIEEVPYQISLQYTNTHNCGGSIISKDWVVTAGHCVGGSAAYYSVHAGSSFHNRNGTRHNATRIVRHQAYNITDAGIPVYDIALVRVSPPFVFNSNHQSVKLFGLGEPAPANATSTITGWGRTENGTAKILQLVTIPIVSKTACDESYQGYGGIPDGQICAAYPQGGKDSCQGDSGGPLTIGGRLAGIVSWGYGCAVAGNPGVYTEIAAYRFWIKSITGV